MAALRAAHRPFQFHALDVMAPRQNGGRPKRAAAAISGVQKIQVSPRPLISIAAVIGQCRRLGVLSRWEDRSWGRLIFIGGLGFPSRPNSRIIPLLLSRKKKRGPRLVKNPSGIQARRKKRFEAAPWARTKGRRQRQKGIAARIHVMAPEIIAALGLAQPTA